MYGRCISSECSSSSTPGRICRNAPVASSSFNAGRRQHGYPRATVQLTIYTQGNLPQWRVVAQEWGEGNAVYVLVMRWTEEEDAFTAVSSYHRPERESSHLVRGYSSIGPSGRSARVRISSVASVSFVLMAALQSSRADDGLGVCNGGVKVKLGKRCHFREVFAELGFEGRTWRQLLGRSRGPSSRLDVYQLPACVASLTLNVRCRIVPSCSKYA